MGRFISEDPIGFAGGDVNFYGYVHSNSINKNDPWGLVDLGYGSPTGPPIFPLHGELPGSTARQYRRLDFTDHERESRTV
ncbi:MAG: hypothetical protein IPK58_01535 [Acidobacteria bacterium]|nr:hypothetical protein [Acidobacteriota bacterium]